MFQVGDYIICGANGVCRVEKIGTMNVPGISKEKMYYTLIPQHSGCSVIYTPTNNEKIVMRPVLNAEEANELISHIQDVDTVWIDDDRRREVIFKEAMRSCDCREIVKVFKTLYLKRKSCILNGKKETAGNEKYLRLAQERLYGELAIPLAMNKEEVERFICDRMEDKK